MPHLVPPRPCLCCSDRGWAALVVLVCWQGELGDLLGETGNPWQCPTSLDGEREELLPWRLMREVETDCCGIHWGVYGGIPWSQGVGMGIHGVA